ncbi:putative Adhesion G protein-coupled receptor E2 [Hypsibius exemplaris]|uniref:Adhesion G protein-coupled receptor E2 n=1 Tax=Hypsibius exemplaris TaxID=2072580 RepID=A0A1W0X069_HYPEX|nr:putative Adhesion G protein-coupled receptor E2 [Hypsibius exemplaris]
MKRCEAAHECNDYRQESSKSPQQLECKVRPDTNSQTVCSCPRDYKESDSKTFCISTLTTPPPTTTTTRPTTKPTTKKPTTTTPPTTITQTTTTPTTTTPMTTTLPPATVATLVPASTPPSSPPTPPPVPTTMPTTKAPTTTTPEPPTEPPEPPTTPVPTNPPTVAPTPAPTTLPPPICYAEKTEFLQDNICKNAFDLDCWPTDDIPCVVVKNIPLRCNSVRKCACPFGLVMSPARDGCTALQLKTGGEFERAVVNSHKHLELCEQEANCSQTCYAQPNVSAVCHCTGSNTAVPQCTCPLTAPRRVQCVVLRCSNAPACESGLSYNATTDTCEDIDECSEDSFNHCDMSKNEGFEALPPANVNDRLVCTDVNECVVRAGRNCQPTGSSNCTTIPEKASMICGPVGNVCTNTIGSYYCRCASGYHYINQTCVRTTEIEAYDQVCSNQMAYRMTTPNGPVCKCRRTFYKNSGGYCLVGSHVYEFLLHTTAPFNADLENETHIRYQQLAEITEKWLLEPGKLFTGINVIYPSLKRAAADLFTVDPITEMSTVIHVTLVFDTRDFNGLYVPFDESLLDAVFERVPVDSSSKCTLQTTTESSLVILTAPTYANFKMVLLDPCQRERDHNCFPVSTVCSHNATAKDYCFRCPCAPGFNQIDFNDHQSVCSDEDECRQKNPVCRPKGIATCTNTLGSYTCSCPKRYVLTGGTCVERNRCEEIASICGYGRGTCVAGTYPAYTCQCDPGFAPNPQGDGCEDVDECQDSTALKQCAANFARCVNTIGKFKCECNSGFYNDTITHRCRISAYAFELEVELANSFVPEWKDTASKEFLSVESDADKVFQKLFEAHAGQCCTGGEFAGVQVKQLQGHGRSYTRASLIVNIAKGTAAPHSIDDCNIDSVINFTSKRLPELCDPDVDQTGTCLLYNTDLRLPVITITKQTVTRTLPEKYKVTGSQVVYGCDKANDCTDNHNCKTVAVTATNSYPYECTCKAPLVTVGTTDNMEDCIDNCDPNPCHQGSCDYQDDPPGYVCKCPESHLGYDCSGRSCPGSYCNNQGTCVLEKAGKTCTCDAFYSGNNCDRNIAEVLAKTLLGFFGGLLILLLLLYLLRRFMRRGWHGDWWPPLKPSKIKQN